MSGEYRPPVPIIDTPDQLRPEHHDDASRYGAKIRSVEQTRNLLGRVAGRIPPLDLVVSQENLIDLMSQMYTTAYHDRAKEHATAHVVGGEMLHLRARRVAVEALSRHLAAEAQTPVPVTRTGNTIAVSMGRAQMPSNVLASLRVPVPTAIWKETSGEWKVMLVNAPPAAEHRIIGRGPTPLDAMIAYAAAWQMEQDRLAEQIAEDDD